MKELLPAIERDDREISKAAARILGLLAAADTMPKPALYQQVIRDVARLAELWSEHGELLSEICSSVSVRESHFTSFLKQFERESAELDEQLLALSSAGWPRTAEIGVNLIRFRVAETLIEILHQIERERITVVPLLRRLASQRARAASTLVVY